jgi:tetratricopeptide (TPR) repeat protein
MRLSDRNSKHIVTLVFGLLFSITMQFAPVWAQAQTSNLDDLFAELQKPDLQGWKKVQEKILATWAHSGSDTMDLLLQRGSDALEEGRIEAAIGHFSALIDHAPDFAEGWNARATAFYLAGEYGLSIHDIQQTLALNPRHFGAMAGLGRILEQMQRPEQALIIYRHAFAVHPHMPDVIRAIERLEKQVEGTAL